MSLAHLDALRALDAARVQGEYYVHTDAKWIAADQCEGISCQRPDGTSVSIVVTETGHYPPDMATAQWLAAISNAGPGLIDEVERLRARVAEQDAILEEYKHAAWERSERD